MSKQIDSECKAPAKGAVCTEHTCAYGPELKRAAGTPPPLVLK